MLGQHGWLIRTDVPFTNVQSVMLEDGTVGWTDGWTPEQYAAERGFPVKVISDAELDALLETRLRSLITEPTEESEKDFWYALEVLPPCRWGRVKGVEMFHISERIEGNIVAWHAQLGGRYATCNDSAGVDREALADKFAAHFAKVNV